MAVDVLICVATDLESALLRERLKHDSTVAIVRMGVGPVNAAHAVTMFLATTGARQIVVCGVGGAYPSSSLHIGNVVCAELECYGDLGAMSPAGFLDMKALGFPVIGGQAPLYNELPMQLFPLQHRVPFVTVSCCTGTEDQALAIETRTRGCVENMEGAAVAHVAHLHHVPVGEVRGISNIVTNRDTTSWRLDQAAAAAQEAVLSWIASR